MTFCIQKANFTAKHFPVVIQCSIAQEQQCKWCMEAYSNNTSLKYHLMETESLD